MTRFSRTILSGCSSGKVSRHRCFRKGLAVAWLFPAVLIPVNAPAASNAVSRLADLSLEQLLDVEVVTASRFPQKLSEAPSMVSVITAEDIRTYGYRTLADILRSVRGLNVSNDRNYSYLNPRGLSGADDYNSAVLLLLDGYRLNENVYGGAYIGTEFILDVDLIERVEYMSGPGSAVYGSNAFYGVVNVITRRGASVGGVEASAEAGSYGTAKGRLSYGERHKSGLDVLVSASGYGSEGQTLYFPEFSGVAENLDDDHARQFFFRLNSAALTFEAGYSNRTKSIPTASFLQVFNAPGSRTTDAQQFINLRYDEKLTPTLDLATGIHYGRYDYTGFYQYSYGTNKDITVGEWWGADLRLQSRAFAHHKLIAGLEYRNDFRREQQNFDVNPYLLYLHDEHGRRSYGLYVQDEWALGKDTLLNAGLRHDGTTESRDSTNPRIALIQKLGSATTAKFLYGTAFRAPNAYELYYATIGGSYLTNPNLKPETIATSEASLEHYFGSHLRLLGSLFSYHTRDMILLAAVGPNFQFQNLARVSTRGAEAELEYRWSAGARLRASYTRQEAVDDTTDQWLKDSPRHLAKLNLSVPVFNRNWRAGMEAQYAGEQRNYLGTRIDDATVANLTLSADRLLKNLDVSASVYNLFDRKLADPALPEHQDSTLTPLQQIVQNGRNFRLTLTYRF